MLMCEFDWRSPLVAYAPLAGRDGAFLLHGGDAATQARWSFIAAAPQSTIVVRNSETFVDGAASALSPFQALSAMHEERRRLAPRGSWPPLMSGMVGFCGYECGRYCEPSAIGPPSPFGLPDFFFGAYDAIAAFDRQSRRANVFGRSSAAIDELASLLGDEDLAPPLQAQIDRPLSNFSPDAYRAAVSNVIEKIRNGDLFQANISQRFTAQAREPIGAFDFFRAAARDSSSAFGACFSFGGADVISQSPERFFSVASDGERRLRIVAEPVKGTRARGKTVEDDERLLAELIADPKDRAENIMIADLTRNDLSKICDDGTICEEAICEAVTHATVHHLVSRISGRLRNDVNAADALFALFPCGSITGAPKAEAMKAIAAVEQTGRGPYCGAIGYIDDHGGADFSVAIRLAMIEGRQLFVPAGGGITLRSDPATEYEETLTKARQFLRLIELGGREAP